MKPCFDTEMHGSHTESKNQCGLIDDTLIYQASNHVSMNVLTWSCGAAHQLFRCGDCLIMYVCYHFLIPAFNWPTIDKNWSTWHLVGTVMSETCVNPFDDVVKQTFIILNLSSTIKRGPFFDYNPIQLTHNACNVLISYIQFHFSLTAADWGIADEIEMFFYLQMSCNHCCCRPMAPFTNMV